MTSSDNKLTFDYNIFNDVSFVSSSNNIRSGGNLNTYYAEYTNYEDYSTTLTLDTDELDYAPNSDGELTLGCRKCGVDYGSSTELKLHFGAVHSRQTFECCVCNKLFIRRHGFLVHIKKFHEDVTAKSFPCPFCEQIYTTADALNEHCQTQHKVMQQICPLCSTQVPEGTMKTHIDKEHPLVLEPVQQQQLQPLPTLQFDVKRTKVKRKWPQIKSHQCHLCPYETNRPERLRVHIQGVHAQIRAYPCMHCEKSFKQKDKLNRHISSVHSKDKAFGCDYCSMSFARKDEYNRHITTVHAAYIEDKPKEEMEESYEWETQYQCPHCSHQSNRYDKHKIHMINAHSDDRPHACNFCTKRFKLKDKLNLHVNTVHLKRKPHECQYCKQAFGRRDAAKRHETKWCALRKIK